MKYILRSNDALNNVINLNKSMNGRFELYSFGFTNNIFNVTSNNNILPYQEGATYTAIELTQQYRNGHELATDVAAKINAISVGTASVSYDDNTGRMTISNTTNFYLKFGDVTSNTCHHLLGFNTSNTTNGTSVASDKMCDLIPFKTIFIDISEDCNRSIGDQDYNHYTFIISGSSNFGELFAYKSFEWSLIPQYMQINEHKRLKITFYDENKNVLNLLNWFIVLHQH